MRTRLILLSTALLAGGALASPALAAPPERIPPMPEPFEVQACDTTLLFEEVVQKERVHVKEGKLDRVTGSLKIRITNLENGESLLVNASGPGTFQEIENEDGTLTIKIAFKGRNLIFPEVPEDLAFFQAAGLPDVFITSGPLNGTITLSPDGEVEELTLDTPRRVQDVCQILT